MYNPYSLAGKTILVTGASSGIGKVVAQECAKMGASLVISGRNPERLHETFVSLEGGGHIEIVADLLQYEDIESLTGQCPLLDGFSNNAGITKILLLKNLQRKYLEEIMNTNAIAPILLTQLLTKKKKWKKPSSIVFTSAISGNYCVHYGESMFAASKGAVCGFAKGAALDLAAQNIRVNCVTPGVIKTDSLMNSGVLTQEELKEKENYFPLKRFGDPKDVALAVIYLLSDASSWVTGDNLILDGGYTLL
ncbi:SDR family NAD(P)-dependent oxidoreductase [Odoribacter splanchnicus]|jgi:oxidoreductase, short chain dehydrogenase/reductase family|uniref:SDR family NAD(P)-dependent oxidoreductase n=1 Tax=Odoribacter splanchnicus TaxID=28118 RepID=UPI000E4C2914|nr:SDR family oxidoreductase [Odoribacter splanchnicus]NUN81340.1 SDR family oxidoreductase [Odoribacter splanchnicus]RHL78861.1 SDR family NAD(P)-dependent oxidoreductase [Odoribacter splanchnicus]